MNSNIITLKTSKSTVDSFIAYARRHHGTIESRSNRLFSSRVRVSFDTEKDLKFFSNGLEEEFGKNVSLAE